MTEYLTEQEQIQQLKNWLKQYGMPILAGVIVAAIVTSGWQYWQSYRNRILSHASNVYDEMLTLRAQNNTEGAGIQAKKLLDHYTNTPYASIAAFMLAREAVLKKNYDEAMQQLHWIIGHSKNRSLRQIARIRLARILITEQKPDAALHMLEKIENKEYIGLINEVRGDAFVANHELTAAQHAYREALTKLPNAEVNRPILQMKYDNLVP